jgi:hypothetical protein
MVRSLAKPSPLRSLRLRSQNRYDYDQNNGGAAAAAGAVAGEAVNSGKPIML